MRDGGEDVLVVRRERVVVDAGDAGGNQQHPPAAYLGFGRRGRRVPSPWICSLIH